MRSAPLILIAPGVETSGFEFNDRSISLSECYPRAVMQAGGIPLLLPPTLSPQLLRECVFRADGVMLTGGEDVDPGLYAEGMSEAARKTVNVTPDGGQRDLREILLIKEVFSQQKPLLAICRGHQLLNVALGGTLIADIASQSPGGLNHRRLDKRSEVVHEVRLTPDSLVAKITGKRRLRVNSTHHQAIGRVAGPLRATAVSPDGILEALELQPGAAERLPFLLGVQFHPERLVDRFREHRDIFGAFTRACAFSHRA